MNGVEGSTLNFIIMDWRGIPRIHSDYLKDCTWRYLYAVHSSDEPPGAPEEKIQP